VDAAVPTDSGWLPPFGGEPIVSYSQNAEDVRLWRVFRTIENGFYVDIGAADPRVDSVTCLFYENGWSGINVEPSPSFDALVSDRPRDVNLNIAVGAGEGSVSFFLTQPYLGLSTFDPAVHARAAGAVDQIREVTVLRRRLAAILEEHAGDRTIHFLKVDVEGAEPQVLASSDWTRFRPVVVVVESIESLSTTSTHETWEQILLDAEYRFAAFDGINRFYVDRGHEDLIPVLAYPISALDRYVTAAAHDLADRLESKSHEAESLQRTLDAVHGSRAWRVGRALASVTRPLRGLREHLPWLGSG
jgi:FkbM family methyltransferase